MLPFNSLWAGKKSLNPFDFAAKIQDIFRAKKYNSLQSISSVQAKISEQEFLNFYLKPASEELANGPSLSTLLIGADRIYIQSGKGQDGKIGGVIYFITQPKKVHRKQWLVDYAACAFKTVNNAFVLVEGFCFLGTDGAPELEPSSLTDAKIPEARR
jgi:hypothetical protein